MVSIKSIGLLSFGRSHHCVDSNLANVVCLCECILMLSQNNTVYEHVSFRHKFSSQKFVQNIVQADILNVCIVLLNMENFPCINVDVPFEFNNSEYAAIGWDTRWYSG